MGRHIHQSSKITSPSMSNSIMYPTENRHCFYIYTIQCFDLCCMSLRFFHSFPYLFIYFSVYLFLSFLLFPPFSNYFHLFYVGRKGCPRLSRKSQKIRPLVHSSSDSSAPGAFISTFNQIYLLILLYSSPSASTLGRVKVH